MLKTLTLIVPCYNPIQNWETNLLKSYQEFCNAAGTQCKVVLVNDGCTFDIENEVNTLKNALQENLNYIVHPVNKGKGATLKTGVRAAQSDVYMFTDVDFPYTIESMKNVYFSSCQHSGISTGYRKAEYYQHLSPTRALISKTLRWLNSFVLGLPTNDTQCGLKAFDNEIKPIFLACKTDRFLLDLELLLATNAQKLGIHPVHVQLNEGVTFTKFNFMILFKELGNFFNLLLKYRILKSNG